MLAHIHPCERWFAPRLVPLLRRRNPGSMSGSPPRNRQVPRAPLPDLRYYRPVRVVSSHDLGRRYPSFVAPIGSCAGPNPSRHLRFPLATGLCRLLPVPAGRWSFPTLSPQSLRRRLDPYPAELPRCSCPLLPQGQRPRVRTNTLGARNTPVMQLRQRIYFGAAVIR